MEIYDIAVIGAGSAGVAAAIAAAKNGAKTVLVESGPIIGGDLLSGLPIDGCRSSCGEWIVGGVAKEIFEKCAQYGGYVDSISDRRNLWVVMINPRIMGFVLLKLLSQYGISLLPYTQVTGVDKCGKRINGIKVSGKAETGYITAKHYIDCTGDGDVAMLSGAPFAMGGENGELQPVSIVFQMRNLDSRKLLAFVRDHSENCGLGENPNLAGTARELAQELYDQGIPKIFFSGDGPMLSQAIKEGKIYPCSMLTVTPNTPDYRSVTINSTRTVIGNPLDPKALGEAMLELTEQVDIAVGFLQKTVPGFEEAVFDGIAPRLGIRETRRIEGEYILNKEDVTKGIKRPDGICKGGHEVDVHGAKKDHLRYTIKDAGSYDIPYGSLLPKNTENLFVAGRCLSADRIANSSARVMGTCMATGQAAGTAAAMCAEKNIAPRELEVSELRALLRAQGAILEGTK